jgi:hypothetical protein
VIGDRLVLAPGRYRLSLDAEEPARDEPPPTLEVAPERATPRRAAFERTSAGLAADFDVGPDERVVTLRVRGGGPFRLHAVVVQRAQPFPAPSV